MYNILWFVKLSKVNHLDWNKPMVKIRIQQNNLDHNVSESAKLLKYAKKIELPTVHFDLRQDGGPVKLRPETSI